MFEGKRNLALAEKCARDSVRLAGGPDKAASLDTLARIRFMQGQKDEAIKLQEESVKLAADELKPELQGTLDAYKKGVLPKVSDQGEIDDEEMK